MCAEVLLTLRDWKEFALVFLSVFCNYIVVGRAVGSPVPPVAQGGIRLLDGLGVDAPSDEVRASVPLEGKFPGPLVADCLAESLTVESGKVADGGIGRISVAAAADLVKGGLPSTRSGPPHRAEARPHNGGSTS